MADQERPGKAEKPEPRKETTERRQTFTREDLRRDTYVPARQSDSSPRPVEPVDSPDATA